MQSRGIQVCILFLLLSTAGAQTQPSDGVQPQQPTPSLQLTPDRIDFGNQPVGVASAPRTAILTNIGQGPVTIHDITASGIDFGETNKCQGQLAPRSECTIQVSFTPAITGPRMGTIIITGSDPASPRFLVVTGTGE